MDLIDRNAVLVLAKDICVETRDGAIYSHRSIDPCDVLELPSLGPMVKKKYVIQKDRYSKTVVLLTEWEARAISNFIDWACLEDDYVVERVEDYVAEEWGLKGTAHICLTEK